MQFRIEFDSDINPYLYRQYSLFLFRRMNKSLCKLADRGKYKIRESLVLNSSLIKWKVRSPETIDLYKYILTSLELVKDQGTYVIRTKKDIVPWSFTKRDKLIRMLEYGTSRIKPYPVLRKVFWYYSKNYKNLFYEFMKESFSE